MFWLVEEEEQFKHFKALCLNKVFVLPIKVHPGIHPGLQPPMLLFVQSLENEDSSYLLNFSHPEAFKLNLEDVKKWLTGVTQVFTPDKKALNYYYYGNNTFDLNLCSYCEIKSETVASKYYLQHYENNKEVNKIIPIVKHFEEAKGVYKQYKSIISTYVENQYHTDLTNVFWFVEKEGLKTTPKFSRFYNLEKPFLSKTEDFVYTRYNLNTQTGRPSNTFNTINFAALSKHSHERTVFIPRNNVFVELDIVAYHPTLIANLVDYKIKGEDIYEDFANLFNLDRVESKKLIFKQLYGNVFEQYSNFEFFVKTKAFIEQIWKQAMKDGFYTGFISNQKFYIKDVENPTPQKFFNYLIQNYETANNVQILKQVIGILTNKKTKVVLYVYDAILLDVCKEDVDCLSLILDVFKSENLKVKMSHGLNYDKLVEFKV